MFELLKFDFIIQERYGPVGLVHVDAHTDTAVEISGEKIAHGTPFRRAMEEGCLDGNRVIQIGIRETCGGLEGYDWGEKQVTITKTRLFK